MPNIQVVDMQGKQVGTMELNDEIFAIEPNVAAMHLMVRSYLAAQRQGTQSAKTREWSAAAAVRSIARRAPATLAIMATVLRSSVMAASYSRPSPGIT